MVTAARQPEQKARREQIAGAGGVDQPLDRRGRHRRGVVLATTTQPFSLRVTTASLASLAAPPPRCRNLGLIEAVQLALVGKHEVDNAFTNEVEKSAR